MCEARLAFLTAYDKAVESYATVTTDLKILVNCESGRNEFDQLYDQVAAALAIVRAAKLALREHRNRHCC